MIPSWKWTRKDCFSDIPLIEGEVKHPIFTVWRFLTSDSDVKSRQTKNESTAKTVAIASKTHFLQCVFTDLWAFLSSFLPVLRWYLSQFSTDFYVILQAPSATIMATALKS